MTIKIRTRTIGQHFATIGQAVALNGRVVYESALVGYGNEGGAADLTESWAVANGHQVLGVEPRGGTVRL